jgi:hypothetical protein
LQFCSKQLKVRTFDVEPTYSMRAILSRRICDTGNTLSRESIVTEVRAEISRLQQVLALLNDGNVPSTPSIKSVAESTARPTRQISAAGRARIAAATRARWAKIRAEQATGKVAGNSVVTPRRKVSASARKRMASAQKARWAKIKAAEK